LVWQIILQLDILYSVPKSSYTKESINLFVILWFNFMMVLLYLIIGIIFMGFLVRYFENDNA